MKNKRLIIVVLLGMIGSLFASGKKNSWTIGLYTGIQGQIISSVKQEYTRAFYIGGEKIINMWDAPMIRIQHALSHIPPVELTVKYNIGNCFSIVSGVGYRSYYLKVKDNPFYNFTTRGDFIQVPIIFQYNIPLKKKGFSVFIQGGIGIDIGINSIDRASYSNEYDDRKANKVCYVENTAESYFNNGDRNLLLHTGVGFSYNFDSGIGISLLGRYNTGALYISTHSYHTVVKEVGTDIIEQEIKEQLYGKAECWNVLLGVTYTFKKKEKQ
jgi:hypothetical protein